jgi:hypothetical protein
MSRFDRDNLPDRIRDPSVAVTTATISGVVHSNSNNHGNDSDDEESVLTFFQWMKHEPVAMIVIATILSLAIQRVGLRFESLVIRPALTKFVDTCDPESCVMHNDDDDDDEECSDSERTCEVSPEKNKVHQGSETQQAAQPPTIKRKKKVTRKFDSSKVEMYSNNVVMVLCVTIADLLFNFAIVYLVYRLFVRSGGLAPKYGTSRRH